MTGSFGLSKSPAVEIPVAPVVSNTVVESKHLQVTRYSEDIRRLTVWTIDDPWDTIVLHLAGKMNSLETELEGHGGSVGPALAGEIWTIPAGRAYASQAQGNRIDYLVFRVHPALRKDRPLPRLAGHYEPCLARMAAQLNRVATDSVAQDTDQITRETLHLRVERYLCHTFGNDQAKHVRTGRKPSILSPRSARALRCFIHGKLGDRILLSDMCRITDMKPHNLLEAFHGAFGTTPAQYIIRQRLRCTQRLLSYTSMPVTAIALRCGFATHSHLTSTFSAHLGMTPTRYRKLAHS